MNQFAIDRTHFCKRSRDNILIMVCTVFAEADENKRTNRRQSSVVVVVVVPRK